MKLWFVQDIITSSFNAAVLVQVLDKLHKPVRTGVNRLSDFIFNLSNTTSCCETDIFLQDEFMAKANGLLRLPETILSEFHGSLSLLREHPQLVRWMFDYHQELFHPGDGHEPGQMIERLPQIQEFMGSQAGMFAAVGILSGLPHISHFYQFKGISQEVLIDTMSDLEVWMKHYHATTGYWGLSNTRWLLHHMNGRIFRLGRLQFMARIFRREVNVFRNVRNGRIAALSEPEVIYRPDGMVEGTNGIYAGEAAWKAEYQETETHYNGFPISAKGYALHQLVRLPRSDWRLVLKKENPILDIHIAEGSKMDYDLCRDSMYKAVKFYNHHFPEFEYRAFSCNSWLLDPQFQSLLPDSSNIIKFQRDFYLVPLLSDAEETNERVFGVSKPDLAVASRDTSMRRAILDYIAAGNQMRSAAGFLLKEDLENGFTSEF